METKIVSYDELVNIVDDYDIKYNYFGDYSEMLNQEYFNVYIANYKEELSNTFKENGLEVVDVKLEYSYDETEVEDVKIIPYFNSWNHDFFRKNKLYAGEIEKCIASKVGLYKEKKFPSGFYNINDFLDDVYFSLKDKELYYSEEETDFNKIYEVYINTLEKDLAFVKFIQDFDNSRGIERLFDQMLKILDIAQEDTFVYKFKESLRDYIIDMKEEIYDEYDIMNIESDDIFDVFDISDDEEDDNNEKIEEIKEVIIEKLIEFYDDNYEEYDEFINEKHHDIWEKIFVDFCKEHKIEMPISVSEYIDSNFENKYYKVIFDEDGDVVDIEMCDSKDECE